MRNLQRNADLHDVVTQSAKIAAADPTHLAGMNTRLFADFDIG
jgi:hypothetical protein